MRGKKFSYFTNLAKLKVPECFQNFKLLTINSPPPIYRIWHLCNSAIFINQCFSLVLVHLKMFRILYGHNSLIYSSKRIEYFSSEKKSQQRRHRSIVAAKRAWGGDVQGSNLVGSIVIFLLCYFIWMIILIYRHIVLGVRLMIMVKVFECYCAPFLTSI